MPNRLIHFPADMDSALQQLSHQTGLPITAHVRQAVSAYLSGSISCGFALGDQLVSGAVLTLTIRIQ